MVWKMGGGRIPPRGMRMGRGKRMEEAVGGGL